MRSVYKLRKTILPLNHLQLFWKCTKWIYTFWGFCFKICVHFDSIIYHIHSCTFPLALINISSCNFFVCCWFSAEILQTVPFAKGIISAKILKGNFKSLVPQWLEGGIWQPKNAGKVKQWAVSCIWHLEKDRQRLTVGRVCNFTPKQLGQVTECAQTVFACTPGRLAVNTTDQV